jgi:flagellar hook-basal body complex protein FliE
MMDAISALRTMAPPDTNYQFASAAQKAASAQPVSIPDLGQADAVALPQSTDGVQSSGTFENFLGGFVNEVNQKQLAASDSINGLLSGKNVSLHQTMISMEEASVSFQMMTEVRTKLLDAYQELMKMQI